MKRKVAILAAASIAAVLLILLFVVLDIGSWKTLDMEKLRSFTQSTLILDGKDRQAAVISGAGKRTVIALGEIPTKVQHAFLAAEDIRFYSHPGVDFYRIGGALLRNIKERDYAQGASTITQQLIKLTHLTAEKTISRKLQEALLALQLERRASKDEILEMYLNVVYFGKGAYGIEAAAQGYFGISASQLTLGQGALLAGVLKSPSSYAPHLSMENSLERRQHVLGMMVEAGFITQMEADQTQAEPVALAADSETADYAWYVDQTIDEACKVLGIDAEALLCGGYTIYTALETDMQQSAQDIFEDSSLFPQNAPDGERAQAALVALDAETGEVLCLIGGRSYDVQRGLNRASDIKRQPGSAFKPVSVYAAAIDLYGMLPSSLIDDTQRSFGTYAPRNSGGNYHGLVTLREALSKSLNVATVDLLTRTDIESARRYAQRAGLELDDQDANLSFALGSLTQGVSPMALCASYAPLANGGHSVKPHLIRKIVDAQDELVYTASATSTQVMKAESAYMIGDMLQTASKSGSARALASVGFPVAGKTGTVGFGDSGNRDAWTVAFTPSVCAAVWMGFDNPDEGHKLSNAESGSNQPAKLAATFLSANAARANAGAFDMPGTLGRALIDRQGLIALGRPMLPSLYTPKSMTVDEVFPIAKIPTEVSSVWVKPASVYNLSISTNEAMVSRLSFTAVQGDALYRVYRIEGGVETLIAELQGQPGDQLVYIDEAGGGNSQYYVRPIHALLSREGVLLEGDASQMVSAKRNPFFDWISPDDPQPTPAPLPIKEETPLFF